MRVLLPLALLFAACSVSACSNEPEGPARSGRVVTTGEAQIGGEWELVDQTGAVRTDADFLGKPQLVYFGFAYCPDVCPASLSRMGAIADQVDPDGDDLHYLFVTVDPERDTPEVLAQYVTAAPFAPGLVGLTGSREQVDVAMEAFRVYAQKVEDDGSAADYLYDHTDFIYVLDEEGKFHDLITPDESATVAAVELKRDFRIR